MLIYLIHGKNNLFKSNTCIKKLICHIHSNKFKIDTDIPYFESINIRNFGIIAHVNHGKSTLADRLLEFTDTIKKSPDNKQVMDQMELERTRGITIKAKTVTMFHTKNNISYMFNLIDTPGHSDFSYEVSRALSACDGVILLIDASQGIQAQTISNYNLAIRQNIQILPVINKIDLKNCKIDYVSEQISQIFNIPIQDIMKVSSKEGWGVSSIIDALVEKLQPPPQQSLLHETLQALLFDSFYDDTQGVVCIIAVKSGKISIGDAVALGNKPTKTYFVKEVGLFRPFRVRINTLHYGYVGYVVLGLKNAEDTHIGDTIFNAKYPPTKLLPGFQKPHPMVYACIYPYNPDDYPQLRKAIQKLILSDSSVSIEGSTCDCLGLGYKLGFLGYLHIEVFCHRLKNEFMQKLVVTQPTVTYKAILKQNDKELLFSTNSEYPERCFVQSYLEPFVVASIVTPSTYVESFTDLCLSRRGEYLESKYIDDASVLLKFSMPLVEVMTDLIGRIKGQSSGYASIIYEEEGYKKSNILRLDVLINKKKYDTFGRIVHISDAQKYANKICEKLHLMIPEHPFDIDIQVVLQGRTLARQKLYPRKPDATRKCYGGDETRKMKLWQKQNEKYKEYKRVGQINIPHDVYCKYMSQYFIG